MNEPSSLEDQYRVGMAPVLRRIGDAHWEKSRATSVGGAGVSTALVLLIAQIWKVSFSLSLSFVCAAVAIPVWLALWQVGEAYSFYGPASHGHFGTLRGSGIGIGLFLTAAALLVASFVALLWTFSVVASCGFLLMAAAMVVLAYKHQLAVRSWAENGSGGGV
jgi:hypothetical protein